MSLCRLGRRSWALRFSRAALYCGKIMAVWRKHLDGVACEASNRRNVARGVIRDILVQCEQSGRGESSHNGGRSAVHVDAFERNSRRKDIQLRTCLSCLNSTLFARALRRDSFFALFLSSNAMTCIPAPFLDLLWST